MPQYARVPSQDGSVNTGGVAGATDAIRSRGDRLQDKCVALAWVVLASIVNLATSFIHKVWSSPEVNRSMLQVSGLGFLVVLGHLLYLTVYLPKVKGLVDSSAWSIYCPRVLPTMALVGLLSYLLFLRAIWPVWGFLAPCISGCEIMGLVMSLHFIPACGLC
eukprot:Nitzschia sp. Nitz4//scaffold46_size129759//49268//49871//NITZ4_003498-RA/size129759-snap-gene-0.7-mRNA-1//1//CDS//3329552586//1857//frame0